jgi:hypothetical protein
MGKPFRCPVCHTPLVEDVDAGFKIPSQCPYENTAYPELSALHDKIYFGKWRKMDADPNDIKRAYAKIAHLLSRMDDVIGIEKVEPARRNFEKADEALSKADAGGDPYSSIKHMDQALSYIHHALNDLLHAKKAKPHFPSDYERHYDVILPFKEDL